MAIVSCASPEDVGEAISVARRHGLELATRAGGHSFAAHSSTRGVLVDVTPMRSVTVAGGVATVGAGARLGEVYQALQEHDLTIPGGTCPPVGVAGLTLGGGLGILGRMYGVTSDHLVGAEVVLADGRLLHCDDHHHQDLFWALRGAGAGNLGVVASLVFRAVPAPDHHQRASGVAVRAGRRRHRCLAAVGPDRARRAGREPEDHRRRRPPPASGGRRLRRLPWVPSRRRRAGRGAGRRRGLGPHGGRPGRP